MCPTLGTGPAGQATTAHPVTWQDRVTWVKHDLATGIGWSCMGDVRGLSRANGVSVGGSAGRVVAWKGCRRYPWTDGRRSVPVVQTGFGHWARNAS